MGLCESQAMLVGFLVGCVIGQVWIISYHLIALMIEGK